MAENYNFNSSFGLNVKTGNGIGGSAQKGKTKEVAGLMESLFASEEEYQKYADLFNGEVAKEIGMYTRQSMIIGMNLRAADEENKRDFDVNI